MSISRKVTVLLLSVFLLPACGEKKQESPTTEAVVSPQQPPEDKKEEEEQPEEPPVDPTPVPPTKPTPGKPGDKPPTIPGKPTLPPSKPGKPTQPNPTPRPKPPSPPTPPSPPNDEVKAPGEALYKSVAWGAAPVRRKWSDTVRAVVRRRFSEFNQAQDKEQFCPGYSTATQAQKENCFIAIIAAIAKFECNFRPALAFREPNGKFSVGLLMLSENECPNARSMAALKNPIQNLVCGANKMATLIARDNAINGPAHARGAAAYWSTLRPPYIHPIKGYKLGKKYLIAAITKNYRGSATKKVMYESMVYENDFPQMPEANFERLLYQDEMQGFYNREDFERVLEME